jgi:inner membrane transporter RhtA
VDRSERRTTNASETPGLRPEILFTLGATSQYVGAAIAVVLFASMPARSVAFLRVLGAAIIVVVVRRAWKRAWTRDTIRKAALFGAVLAMMNLAFYLAIERLPLGNAVAIEFLGPIVVAAIGTATARGVLALISGGAGVVVLAGVTPEGSLAGVGFALLAAALWAGYIILGQRVALSGTGIDGLGLGMAVGALVIAPAGLPGMSAVLDTPWLIVVAMLTGLFSSAIPYGIDQVVLARIPRSRFALLQSMMPAVATVVGLVALSQRPSWSELAGITLVVAGILLAPE